MLPSVRRAVRDCKSVRGQDRPKGSHRLRRAWKTPANTQPTEATVNILAAVLVAIYLTILVLILLDPGTL